MSRDGGVRRDVVHVWLIRTDLAAADLAPLAAVLDDGERRRAAGFARERERRRFVAAHGAARTILGLHLGVPAGEIRWALGPNGKPELSGVPGANQVRVNLSHSAGLAALAAATGRPVGVDVQRLTPGLDARAMSARFYPPAEARYVAAGAAPDVRLHRFVSLWTRKEACVKAAGGRLIPGLAVPVREPTVAAYAGSVVDTGVGRYVVRNFPAPRGYLGAVAAAGETKFWLTYRHWPE